MMDQLGDVIDHEKAVVPCGVVNGFTSLETHRLLANLTQDRGTPYLLECEQSWGNIVKHHF